jgi:hypothetical protein
MGSETTPDQAMTVTPFRGSATDPRDAAYREALDALHRLHWRRNRTSGSTGELNNLERILSDLTLLARGF